MDRDSYRTLKRLGAHVPAHDQSEVVYRRLRDGKVASGLFIRFRKPSELLVGHHTNYFPWYLGSMLRIWIKNLLHLHLPADRIGRPEKLVGHRRVDGQQAFPDDQSDRKSL